MVPNGNDLDDAPHVVPTVPDSDHPLAPGVVAEGELPTEDTRPAADARVAKPPDRQPSGKDPLPEHADDTQQAEDPSARETRVSLLRRHPIAIPAGTLVFALALVAAYLYWDYAGHFESTDDA
ncbi:MAG TPA: hypothetical protein VGO08_22150, partial [Burkholderiales bacterium]|nr:hypothetical protein [Burkholderiales bacterium]